MRRKHVLSQTGFSLIELLIVMALTGIIGTAAVASYSNFVKNSLRESALNALNIDTKIVFKLLENDIQMAGFGLPGGAKVASDKNCVVPDDTFCKINTDRLFVADGSQILTDVTFNGENDGQIQTAPAFPDYASIISSAKINNQAYNFNGGYFATLTNAANAGDTSLVVSNPLDPAHPLNINILQEFLGPTNANTPSDDFKANQALIVTDSATNVEGHRIADVNANGTLGLVTNEALGAYAANSQVVPAVAWYVIKDPDGKTYPDGSPMYWLYRNQNRVIPNVDNFQVTYGYYSATGIVWDNPVTGTVPPTNPAIPLFGLSSSNTYTLRTIQITLMMKFVFQGATQITTYTTVVKLRN